ncbi:hypothetical protein BDW42DRAFT_143358 [Aspergillus taichungensis]|uniref:Uncharacterized protein n=1 Tax=Aspergillus taichungensis TaxID=482145 RepID=A0A2J5HN03_9EURO|nr:hypothetical protein BDW42DRAFT_143358 [Aspergillus taichungensis]
MGTSHDPQYNGTCTAYCEFMSLNVRALAVVFGLLADWILTSLDHESLTKSQRIHYQRQCLDRACQPHYQSWEDRLAKIASGKRSEVSFRHPSHVLAHFSCVQIRNQSAQ